VQLRAQGKSLLISSHELLEVELISDRVGILYEGVLQTMGTINELLTDRDMTVDVTGITEQNIKSLADRGITAEDVVDSRARLRVPPNLSLYDALDILKSQQVNVASVAPRRETLEELFVRIVGDAKAKKEGKSKS
jgi:ABC-2 type transport system ATP-binding protein